MVAGNGTATWCSATVAAGNPVGTRKTRTARRTEPWIASTAAVHAFSSGGERAEYLFEPDERTAYGAVALAFDDAKNATCRPRSAGGSRWTGRRWTAVTARG